MLSVSDIVGIVEDENLSLAISDLVSPSRIKDTELAAMWEEARELLTRIQEYLDLHSGEDDDEYDEEELY